MTMLRHMAPVAFSMLVVVGSSSLVSASDPPPFDPARVLTSERTEAALTWQQHLLCIVRVDKPGVVGKSLPEISLSIYDTRDKRLAMPTFSTVDHLLAMFPLGQPSGPLVTIWSGPTGYHLFVFAFENGTVHQVLDAWSRFWPEIIDLGPSQLGLRLSGQTSDGDWAIPDDPVLFKWTGREFTKCASVSWAKRLLEGCVDDSSSEAREGSGK